MTNPYDDPDQRPVARYSICHNDDDPTDPKHRRVEIEVLRRPVGDYEIFADGEPSELAGDPAETKAEAIFVVERLWGDPVWDLRQEG